jgi:D-threo-aldose 1-dehydrogenase
MRRVSLTAQTVQLGDTGIETTRLGFGCANLFRRSARARRRLLDTAYEAGIRHFDAAPMYGLGGVEGEVARFARGKRDRLVIATKLGIAPRLLGRAVSPFQPAIEKVFAAVPATRDKTRPQAADARSGTIGHLLYRTSGYDARAARGSLERSLRSLRTDYVDILLLHDPAPSELSGSDVVEFLESARQSGSIRAWGVAGEVGPAIETVRRLGVDAPVLQLRGDVFARRAAGELAAHARASIWFGVIDRALPLIVSHVTSSEPVRRRWNDAVGADCSDAGVVARLLLRDALRESDTGPVLFGTTRTDRVEAAVAVLSSDQLDAPVEALRALIADDLGPEEETG